MDHSFAFVSYSREDLEFARRLAADLRNAGAQVWMDKLDIHPGQPWERVLEDALAGASRILVILSPASVDSENVMAEAAFGLDERKEIIPILYRECKIPFRLRPIQYVDFRREEDYAAALRELLATLGVEQAPAAERHEIPPRRPRWMMISIAAVVLAAIVWFTASKVRQQRGDTRTITAEVLPSSGWALGLHGMILHSEDAGATWTPQTSGVTENLVFAAFSSAQTGWVVGDDGVALNTHDGGATWQKHHTTPKHYLASVFFPTTQSGWIGGSDGTILHTEDGGGHWDQQTSATGETMYSIVFPTPQSGFIVGSAGTVLHTENGGGFWNPQNGGTDRTLFSAAFPTARSGWAVGNGGTIVHTDDAGVSWRLQNSGVSGELISVFFATPGVGWAVGKNGTVLHTDDSGVHWTPQSSGTSATLNCVWFANPRWGWAAGFRGILLHTEDGGANWKLQRSGSDADEVLFFVSFARPG